MKHDMVNCSNYCTTDCGCSCHIKLALKRLPTFAAGIFDPLSHKRVSDLRFAVQTELDTYEEGDNPLEPKQVAQLRRFMKDTNSASVSDLPHREVMGDECAIDGCPYEHDGDSQYCADHKSSASVS